MANSRNNRSFSALFDGFGKNLNAWVIAAPKAYLDNINYKLKHLPLVNFNLGCDFADQGKWQDAIFRFRVALYFQPDYPKAHYNLGCCYLRTNNRIKAKAAFIHALKVKSTDADALFMLSALDPSAVPANSRPTRMPAKTITDFFGGLAERYDAIELTNHYHGGKMCFDALKSLIAGRTGLRVVDLGCGTGIASRPWRNIASHVTGIDFTPAMLQAARAVSIGDKPLFDELLENDLVSLATATASLDQADVILCCNVAQFVGDVQPLLQTLATQLKIGALVALTIEPFNIAAGYGVNIETGRFGHHPEAIKKIIQTLGFELKNEARVNLYPGVAAQLFIIVKAA
jgi:predicted TPR repeat methyltransferase